MWISTCTSIATADCRQNTRLGSLEQTAPLYMSVYLPPQEPIFQQLLDRGTYYHTCSFPLLSPLTSSIVRHVDARNNPGPAPCRVLTQMLRRCSSGSPMMGWRQEGVCLFSTRSNWVKYVRLLKISGSLFSSFRAANPGFALKSLQWKQSGI